MIKGKKKLEEVIASLDERLEDFKELVQETLSYELDYSLESIRYVELLLTHLKPTPEEDKEILLDSGLYIGETVKRNHSGAWDIYDGDDEAKNGQPVVKNIGEDKRAFFPFLEIKEFAKNPAKGYFKKWMK